MKSPIWVPPDAEAARQIETAQGHLAIALVALDAAMQKGDPVKTLHFRQHVQVWQSTLDALTRK